MKFNNLTALCTDNKQLARWVSLIVRLKHMKETMEFFCVKQMGPLYTLFQLLLSFSTLSDLSLLQVRLLASYV